MTDKTQAKAAAFEVRFLDVQIDGDVRSWQTVLKTFSCGEIVRHLAKRGLQLNCTEDAKRPDLVTCEDWDDDQGRGEIRLGSTRLIGRFVVRQISDDDANSTTEQCNADQLFECHASQGESHQPPTRHGGYSRATGAVHRRRTTGGGSGEGRIGVPQAAKDSRASLDLLPATVTAGGYPYEVDGEIPF